MSLLSQFSNGAGSLKSASTTIAIAAAAAPSAGQVLRATSATAATWQAVPSGLVLLATLTPTVAANLDFLTVFSATYDNYLVLGEGVNFTTDEGLVLRLAVAGAADVTGTSYVADSTVSGSIALTSGDVRTAGKGANFALQVLNVNDSSRAKVVSADVYWNSAVAGPVYSGTKKSFAYVPASVVSGFRLSSLFGGNFSATGKIRVYGYANT